MTQKTTSKSKKPEVLPAQKKSENQLPVKADEASRGDFFLNLEDPEKFKQEAVEKVKIKKERVKGILEKYKTDENKNLEKDFEKLNDISESIFIVQSANKLLHGKLISQAHKVLANYKDGCFTMWLIEVYGNRQTPYTYQKFYELHAKCDDETKKIINKMPFRTVANLGARKGITLKEKIDFIKNYNNETTRELNEKLRKIFPVKENDKRKSKLESDMSEYNNKAANVIFYLEKAREVFKQAGVQFNEDQSNQFEKLMKEIKDLKVENDSF